MPSANEIGVQGSYGRLAALMGNLPELAIFRKFHEINIQNLLTMQSELVHLEEEYKDICEEDANSECEITRSYQKDWKALQKSKGMGGTLQKDAQSRLQVKLAAYNGALLQQIELCRQSGPSQYDLRLLRLWLISSKGNNCGLAGPGWDVWEEDKNHDVESKKRADLVVLSAKHKGQDYLLRWMGEKAFGLLYRLLGKRMKKMAVVVDGDCGLVEYKDTAVMGAANILSTLLASILITGLMFVLSIINNVHMRLGIVMLLTSLFSITLYVCSEAKRVEIFAATAAFAAAQVVFVGSVPTTGNNKPN
ncbi:hypothetical protein LPUS_10725 [Lasallia pustulata]|uniref:DUF6594 domain-containing protein n=1 Tax=Lasallia pustulata TaxID=136370 RepID=A0A1W5DA81_9LECA|nr:hypothetical protein LPUS_10725 [Lasallia pustulata]